MYFKILKLNFLNCYFIYCLVVDELTFATENTALKTHSQLDWIDNTSKSTLL